MRPSRWSICLSVLAAAAVGGFACDRAKVRQTRTPPSAPAAPQATAQDPRPSPTVAAASFVPVDPNAAVTFTLLNGRVQYEVPALWQDGGGSRTSVDEDHPPADDCRWHLFPDPTPNPTRPSHRTDVLGDGLPAELFPGTMPATVCAYLMEGPRSLRTFTRTHTLTSRAEDDCLIRQDTINGGLRTIRSDWRTHMMRPNWWNHSCFECFTVKGRIGVVFGFCYTRKPRPPTAWLSEALDHARGICASITIDAGAQTSMARRAPARGGSPPTASPRTRRSGS